MPRLVPTGRGPEVVEIGPRECVNGHPLRPPNVQVFSFPCSCSGPAGHRGWRCWTCGEIQYQPPHMRDQGQGNAYAAEPMPSASLEGAQETPGSVTLPAIAICREGRMGEKFDNIEGVIARLDDAMTKSLSVFEAADDVANVPLSAVERHLMEKSVALAQSVNDLARGVGALAAMMAVVATKTDMGWMIDGPGIDMGQLADAGPEV